MRANIVSTLPYIRPRANRRHFALILKTLVNGSETSETLNPTEILHSMSFFSKLQQFQRFCLISKQNLFKKQKSLLLFYHSLHVVNSLMLIETFS
jgi:hypothetical protein